MIEVFRGRDITSTPSQPLQRENKPTTTVERAFQKLGEHSPWTLAHSERVGMVAETVGASLGLPKSEQKSLRRSGTAHDLGKIYIPSEILDRGSRNVTEEERKILDIHPSMSFQILSQEDPESAVIAVAHHEFQDRNYPRNLPRPQSESLNRLQQIVALADQTDALLSERPYKPAWEEEKTRENLVKHFPIEIVNFAIDSRLKLGV